jgi:hypothetical protein
MIEQALYRLLSTNSDVTALVSTRIYPSIAPQNAAKPYVIYQQITEQDIAKNNDGPGNLPAVTFQLDAYAETYAAARQVARAVRSLLRPYRGSVDLAGSPSVSVRIAGVTIVRTTDFNETDVTPKLHRVSRDYRILYAE